ncbi:hypothetical protein FSP39_002069 [Pinctada imbricata]|uniref:Uncharacterized protein n=1 Tax=Pinctada imbricata TaxID=66713 RepID=A0AA88Y8T4_PINIB|nr:hypothetical protein FSP39_002069 [Pinctada imbricata]
MDRKQPHKQTNNLTRRNDHIEWIEGKPIYAGPLCLKCNYAITPGECEQVVRCSDHEACQTWQPIVGKRSAGETKQKRKQNQNDYVDGRTVFCEACCNSGDACNRGGFCGTKGDFSIIKDRQLRGLLKKGPKYRIPSQIDFVKCHEVLTEALDNYTKRWCKSEGVEPHALNDWKNLILDITDIRIDNFHKNPHLFKIHVPNQKDISN